MAIDELIKQLRKLQKQEPDADVYLEGEEWCDRLSAVRLVYFGSYPVILMKAQDGNQS